MKRIVLVFLACLMALPTFAQEQVLTLNEYLGLVKRYHPVALQANLNINKAFYARREALGGFDPKIAVNSERKVFDGKTYYDYLIPEVKVPLWYGIDLKGSYTSYEGSNVNPENKVPAEGLSYLGLSVPLGRGLLIDERRAALKRAAIYQNIAANEQKLMLNDLFIGATNAYADWLNVWLNRQVYKKAVDLAQVRLTGTSLLHKNGDRPAIDTLEALTLLQSRQQKLMDYETLLQNKKNELAAYLWLENLTPTDPAQLSIKPDTSAIELLPPDGLLLKEPTMIAAQNVEVKVYNFKLGQLEIDRKLKLEEIKPTLNVNVGVLNTGRMPFNNLNANWLDRNQKLGFTVAMPLTFMKERAAYSLSKLKIREAEYALSEKRNLVMVKWNNYRNDYLNLDQQVQLHVNIQKNNNILLEAEEKRFSMGESSLFLINSREQKVVETQEKLNEIYTKRIKTIHYLKWLANSF